MAPDGHVVVISTASSLGDQATEIYRELFTGLGIGHGHGRPSGGTETRPTTPRWQLLLREATGVYLTGGNQSRLTQVVAGTRLGDALFMAHDRGAVLAGTSAGASAMASHMVAFGNAGSHAEEPHGAALRRPRHPDRARRSTNTSVSADGSGGCCALVAQSPSLLGLGIDEDTCAIVFPDQHAAA